MREEVAFMKCQACAYELACAELRNEDALFCPRCASPLPSARGDSVGGVSTGVESAGGEVPSAPPAPAPEATALRTFGTKPHSQNKRLHLPSAATHPVFGRERELEEVVKPLRERHAVTLHGGKGLGKTALAGQAVKQLHGDGRFKDGIVWVQDVGRAPVATVCDAIAGHLGNVEIPRLDPTHKLQATLQWMDGMDALLVLDGVGAPETAAAFAQHRADDVALLATGQEPLEGFDVSVVLGPLMPETAVKLFHDRALDDRASAEVCALVSNHALAVVYAAGWVRRGVDARIALLVEQLGREESLLRESSGAGSDLLVRAMLKCVTSDLSDEEKYLLSHLAAVFGDCIGVELLSDACGLSEERCAFLLGRIEAQSLVSAEEDSRFSLHPLLRSFVREELTGVRGGSRERLLEAARRYAARHQEPTAEHYDRLKAELENLLGAVRDAHDRGDWPVVVELVGFLNNFLWERNYWSELLAVGRMGLAAAEKSGDIEARARMMRRMADTLRNQGAREEARHLLRKCLELAGQVSDPGHRPGTLYQLGRLAESEGNYDEAVSYYGQALDIYRETDDREGVAANLYLIGRIALERHDYAEAERLLSESLQIAEQLPGELKQKTARIFNSLALLHEKTGHYTKAEQLYKKALEIYRPVPGSEDSQPKYAGCLHNLAGVYLAMGHYKKATKNYQLALEIRERTFGSKHLEVAQTLNNLAAVYYAEGDYATAAPLWQRALDIYRGASGDSAPHYASVLGNLALIAHAAGDLDEAERLQKEALEIRLRLHGGEHPDVAQILNNLALLYQAKGQLNEAVRCLEEALRINAKSLGEEHPDIAQSLTNLGLVYMELKRLGEAEPLLGRALEIRKRAYRENHPDIAQSLQNLARLYRVMQNYPQAVSHMEESVKVYRAALNDKHPYVAQSLVNLGLLYEVMGRLSEAEPPYRQAVEIYRNTLGASHPDYAAAVGNLAALYHATKDYARAKELYTELLRIHRQRARGDELAAQVLLSLADVARGQGSHEQAESHLRESLEIKKKLADRAGEAVVLERLGQLKYEQGELEEASVLLKQSLALGESLNMRVDIARGLHRLGLVEEARGSGEEAYQLYRRSLEVSRQLGAQSQIALNLERLGQLARQFGREEEALGLEVERKKILEHLGAVESLRESIYKPLTEEEARTLSNKLGVNYEELPGEGHHDKIQELAAAVYRQT